MVSITFFHVKGKGKANQFSNKEVKDFEKT